MAKKRTTRKNKQCTSFTHSFTIIVVYYQNIHILISLSVEFMSSHSFVIQYFVLNFPCLAICFISLCSLLPESLLETHSKPWNLKHTFCSAKEHWKSSTLTSRSWVCSEAQWQLVKRQNQIGLNAISFFFASMRLVR